MRRIKFVGLDFHVVHTRFGITPSTLTSPSCSATATAIVSTRLLSSEPWSITVAKSTRSRGADDVM
jgi:hypothetical protein